MTSKAAILITLLILQGCAAWDNMSVEEKAWQTLNVVDTMQTVDIARNPRCYHEHDALSRSIIGDHPSEGEAVLLGVVYGVLHYQVSRLLERKSAATWIQKTWQWTTLGAKGFTVANNYNIGLHVIPDNHYGVDGCN